MESNLQKKVDRALKLLESVGKTNTDIELAYSGGKDSDVTYLHIQELNETKDSIGNLTREERNIICNALKEFADNRKLPGHLRLNANRIKHYFE